MHFENPSIREELREILLNLNVVNTKLVLLSITFPPESMIIHLLNHVGGSLGCTPVLPKLPSQYDLNGLGKLGNLDSNKGNTALTRK